MKTSIGVFEGIKSPSTGEVLPSLLFPFKLVKLLAFLDIRGFLIA